MAKAILSWSGGKDSALAYHESVLSSKYEIIGLLTVVTKDYERISMHGVRREPLRMQASRMELPVHEVEIPKNASNEIYESNLGIALSTFKREGISDIMFGDLFLQDIRNYREKSGDKFGLTSGFPIWGKDTRTLAESFVDLGFKAVVCCLDQRKLGKEFCGRKFDKKFLSDIPQNVDPCGENGEFHTFVYDGPIFKDKIRIRVGDAVERDEFYFVDILLA